MDKFYTIKEVSDLLRVSKQTVYRLMSSGKIATVKLGKRTLFTETELNRFTESLKTK
jgi:excisionase family DNA binding protein